MVKMKIFHIICLVLFLSLQHSLLLSSNSLFSYFDLEKTYNSYNHRVSEIYEQNKSLKLEIAKATESKSFLEGYARENYGYIKKNEILYQNRSWIEFGSGTGVLALFISSLNWSISGNTTDFDDGIDDNIAKNIKHNFDLAILDEAHRTVGKQDKTFATLLKKKNIKIKKRLFMTATERIVSSKNDEVFSMSDENVYGKRFHELSFKEAIKKNLRTPEDKPTGWWNEILIYDTKVVDAFVLSRVTREPYWEHPDGKPGSWQIDMLKYVPKNKITIGTPAKFRKWYSAREGVLDQV